MLSIKKNRFSILQPYDIILTCSVLVAVFFASTAYAQKGMGDYEGVARGQVKTAVVHLSGTVQQIETHPCESATGPAELGTHLILKDAQKQELNIHVGPAAEVADIVRQLRTGNRIDVLAFRTAKMPADQYVAKTLILDDRVIRLRDCMLRPYWSRGSLLASGYSVDQLPPRPQDGRGRGYDFGRWSYRRDCPRRFYRSGRCFRRGLAMPGLGRCLANRWRQRRPWW